jgi:multidrug efflux system outer membrane protein
LSWFGLAADRMPPMSTLHTGRRKAAARMALQAASGVLALALCGCGSMMARQVAPIDIDVPAAWSAADVSVAGGTTSLAQWWMRFDDPLLGRLVVEALQANTSVQSAQAALRQARALRDVSAAALWPAVGGAATARRGAAGGRTTGSSFAAGLDASWELDIFGANRSALDASEASARASAASLGDVRVSIVAEVALDYIALRGAQTRLSIADDNLASQLETLQLTQWREQAGLVSSLEVEQARSAAEQTRAQLPTLRSLIGQTSHALAVLTGQPPAALSAVLAAPGPVLRVDAGLALSLPAETLRQRPDVRAAEDQLRAALARVAQADAALAPNFHIGGSVGLAALTLGTLTSGSAVVGAVLAGVSMPVFDAGALRAQVRAQEAALDQARAAYEAAVLTALKDVEDALVALRGARERLSTLQRAADAAGNAALLARQRYSSGLIDFQTVLDTQRTQLSTQDSVVGASSELSANHVRLYKALGGGWRPDAGDASPAATEDAPGASRS